MISLRGPLGSKQPTSMRVNRRRTGSYDPAMIVIPSNDCNASLEKKLNKTIFSNLKCAFVVFCLRVVDKVSTKDVSYKPE